MRPRALALLLPALLALAPAAARAYTYGDTLTTIWRPLPNLPALARPGDAFTVWANAPSGAGGWAASLQFGALNVPLAPAGGGWQAAKGRWELQFTVPPATPEEVYALILSSNATAPDTAAHAVKVLPAYKSDYYFAQISDTHLPSHKFSDATGFSTSDTSGMADFDAVIADLNLIHPEFIIHTGDLVNEGELEEYLGMYEMGRAQAMLGRLRDPIFVATGNHDIGGWQPTPPPDGTSRLDWWRYFGWPFLASPPAGDPYHSQDYTFDYGPLHVIGLEAYLYTYPGSNPEHANYDAYLPAIYGAGSFTQEQMSWLQADIAAQPPGTHKLVFYHYDFGGTKADGTAGLDFSQINPTALGIDGDIWGHDHGIAEDKNTPRSAKPFDLGLQSVIDRRAFRIFRVHDGAITPGSRHRSGGGVFDSGSVDSLTLAWSGPNDGSQRALTGTVTNRFGEAWDHARLVFNLVDHESTYVATGGTLAQVIRQGGMANVYVDFTAPAGGTASVSVQPSAPVTAVGAPPPAAFGIRALAPNPFAAAAGAPLTVRFSLRERGEARLEVFDLGGRRVATLYRGDAGPGDHVARWDGRLASGAPAPPAVYLARLAAGGRVQGARFVLIR